MWGLGTRTGVVSVRAEQSEPYFVMGLLVFNTWAEKQRPNLSTELLVFPHKSAGFTGMYHAECSPPDFVFLAARKADKTGAHGYWERPLSPQVFAWRLWEELFILGSCPFFPVERQASLFSLGCTHATGRHRHLFHAHGLFYIHLQKQRLCSLSMFTEQGKPLLLFWSWVCHCFRKLGLKLVTAQGGRKTRKEPS